MEKVAIREARPGRGPGLGLVVLGKCRLVAGLAAFLMCLTGFIRHAGQGWGPPVVSTKEGRAGAWP